ncbi:MAG: hypothetical protein [Circular genetic element sp.]|nr:MAG: hypothetical protein [Circular genetic element sp.]
MASGRRLPIDWGKSKEELEIRKIRERQKRIAKGLQTLESKKKLLDYLRRERGEIVDLIIKIEKELEDAEETKRLDEIKLEEDNKEHLKRLVAIARHDDKPEKLKEPKE